MNTRTKYPLLDSLPLGEGPPQGLTGEQLQQLLAEIEAYRAELAAMLLEISPEGDKDDDPD